MEIKLITKNNFDSQYEEYPVIIFYNEADLQQTLNHIPGDDLCIIDFFKLIDAGAVSIYSKIDNSFVDEIKREIFDTDFERRIRYYLPSGTRFVDVKTMCKTP